MVRVKFFVVALALLILAWSLAFMAVERRSFVDAIYYTFVTVTTVGYGDIHPESTAGKMMAILIILTGTGMFGGLVASMTEMLLNRRERSVRREKLNMVIGAFFSEVGSTLLVYFSDLDSRVEQIKSDLVVKGDWTDAQFQAVAERIRGYDYQVDAAQVDFEHLRAFLTQRREFMLRLLENPTLMEHELFTDLLLAVFHLTEELTHRKKVTDLPADGPGAPGRGRQAHLRPAGAPVARLPALPQDQLPVSLLAGHTDEPLRREGLRRRQQLAGR